MPIIVIEETDKKITYGCSNPECYNEKTIYKVSLRIGQENAYCSKECSKLFTQWILNGPPKTTQFKKGHKTHNRLADDHKFIQKSRSSDDQGYILVRSPKGVKADAKGRIREHRLVIINSIGRDLHDYEVVHHKDGDKHNNKLNNLQLLTKKEHDALHARLKSERTKTSRFNNQR